MSKPLHVTFVCTGNICRSPMAEKMFAHQLRQRGLADAVRVTSAGTGNWHVGSCADERAAGVLRAHGYATDHCAVQVDDDHLNADLVVALGRNHLRILQQLGVDPDRIRMLRSFDPRSGPTPSTSRTRTTATRPTSRTCWPSSRPPCPGCTPGWTSG